MGWIEFAAALFLFLASHRIPAIAGLKARIVASWGHRGYVFVFSLISTALLFWVIFAAARAPYVGLWDQAEWHRWLVNLAMPLVLALVALGVGAANPFAFEGRTDGFDPEHPGIAGLTRQPLLWALALWSFVHLLANGDLAHVILFGLFFGFSVIGLRLVERRKRQGMGEADWQRLSAKTSLFPGVALMQGRWRPNRFPSPLRLVIWVASWAALWHLHGPLIGVWPGV